jgi:hypothetical protein
LLTVVDAMAATLQLDDLGVVEEALSRGHGYSDSGLLMNSQPVIGSG